MSRYVLPGMLGLLVGLVLHWAGFSRQEGLRQALALRRGLSLRSGLTAAGWAMAVTALMCWLAVIDVDTIVVLPLSAGALAGGALLGVAAGLCGFTPSTAFAGLGAGRALEALCVLAGCGLTALLLPRLEGVLSSLHQAAPYSAATLFQVTLDEPFLLGGSFLGQGCAGFLLIAAAICIPSLKQAMPSAEEAPAPPVSGEAVSPDPGNAPEDTFVALLPGEEPLVVDTELDESPSIPDESEGSAIPDPLEAEETRPVSLLSGEELPAADPEPDESTDSVPVPDEAADPAEEEPAEDTEDDK